MLSKKKQEAARHHVKIERMVPETAVAMDESIEKSLDLSEEFEAFKKRAVKMTEDF